MHIMSLTLRRSKNGCNGDVKFFGKYVYYYNSFYDSTHTLGDLGSKLDKQEWINKHLKDDTKHDEIVHLLADWELYVNGWLVQGDANRHLYCYLCQLGGNRNPPSSLRYLSETKRSEKMYIVDL